MPSVSDFFGSWYYKMKVGKAVKKDTTSQCQQAFYDWYQLYLQILFIIFLNIVIVAGLSLYGDDIKTWLVNQIEPHEDQLTDCILILFVLASQSNYQIFALIIWIPAMCLLFRWIWKINKTYILNGNTEFRGLHIHSYWEYWVAYHLLGVRKCKLTLVPIPMQFKVILQGPFFEYLYKEGVQESSDDSKSSILIRQNGQLNDEDSEINLILCDTYPIKLEKQCPHALMRKTLAISRYQGNFTRTHSRKFVESILNEVRKLPPTVTTLHVYSTLNPWNAYEIAKEVFKTGGRDSVACLYVYYQSAEGNRPFNHAERINLK